LEKGEGALREQRVALEAARERREAWKGQLERMELERGRMAREAVDMETNNGKLEGEYHALMNTCHILSGQIA
jgi:hypothetical protein